MIFSSVHFIFIFLPIFLIIYYMVPFKIKNFILLVGSLVFYSYGVKEYPTYLLLLLVSISVNYSIGCKLANLLGIRQRKNWLIIGIIYNLSWLFFFKYTNLTLPIGISFYTFQALAYLADIYLKKIDREPSLIRFGVYIAMFPKMISGPIITDQQFNKQILFRKHSFQKLEIGLREFTLGLMLKVLLANQLAKLWNNIGTIGYESISTPLAWLGMFSFSMQIYLDFYGYSLMAKGLGKALGFQLPDNFNYPYLSVSVSEFYRRWHITLGSWFREYIYIPLGGNRKGICATIGNLFIVWILTGIWHGKGLNFIIWGFVLFVFIAVERLGLIKILERFRTFGHIYILLIIPITWMLFGITDLEELKLYFGKLFPFLGWGGETMHYGGDVFKYIGIYAGSLIGSILCCTKIPRNFYEKYKYKLPMVLAIVIIFWVCIYCIWVGADDPFLYFRF